MRGAHRAGLAAGQKNLAGFDGTTVGYDFAVAEECGRYDECGALRARATATRCWRSSTAAPTSAGPAQQYGDRLAVVLRDRDLSPTGVRRFC